MKKSKSALGMGLSALFSEEDTAVIDSESTGQRAVVQTSEDLSEEDNPNDRMRARLLDVNMLVPGKFQPRGYFDEEKLNELVRSIKENGVIQPILVRTEDTEGRYQIIAGERRWRACKQAGLERIPAVIKELSDREALEVALVENIQRQSLTAIEEAEGYKKLLEEFGYTQEKLASNLGKSRSHISNMLRLLNLPDEIKDFINTGALSMGHARALVNAQNPIELAYKIIEEGLSVRETEKYAAGSGKRGGRANAAPVKPKLEPSVQNTPSSNAPVGEKDPDLIIIENSLSNSMGMKVTIDDTEEGGKVTLYFNNLSELDKILQKLG
ncbi:MAG: ParB/RepB/Spo0J family partition protein [Rickettsiales bacterium]|nr:ParB/RepB/Spo0J family partition protein [Pseudomonadota bacterium]MDA0965778.1 ParB/RepB/Spo0J family partition protein [Pseudomonadota bacterium]MDG4543760.1 ParB/RepB/Spo0J family partition protein [Rickettsiales bacterium]MDG4545907.1 ParB/RepB/Spo0J family partition protein [Rickettsiales bacterium]MDG4548153.1 ParB/RepB/Spo0J family partition protein [Rickettsiales bacterium]